MPFISILTYFKLHLHVVVWRCRHVDGMRRSPLPVARHVSQTGEVRVLVRQSGRLPRLQQSHLLQPLLDLERPLQNKTNDLFKLSQLKRNCSRIYLFFYSPLHCPYLTCNFNYTVTDGEMECDAKKRSKRQRRQRRRNDEERYQGETESAQRKHGGEREMWWCGGSSNYKTSLTIGFGNLS